MERFHEFQALVSSYNRKLNGGIDKSKPRTAPSPFLIQTGNMMKRINLMETRLSSMFDRYVNFHCQFRSNQDEMSESDRKSFDQEITIFAISWTTEINEMKRNCSLDYQQRGNEQCKEHFHAVISYLLDRLQVFTRTSQDMRRLHTQFSLSPFKLQKSRPIHQIHFAKQTDISSKSSRIQSDRKKKEDRSNGVTMVVDRTVTMDAHNTFVERYESEIAPPSKMKEYQQFAAKHKESLLAESKQLSEKYDEDLNAAQNAERAVTGLFEMLNEFLTVMRTQEGLVENVHDASKSATSHVKETDEQLLLTIQRSKSYQMSTVGLILGLAFFLLLLDAVTP